MKTALITGGNGGLGQRLIQDFCHEGYQVHTTCSSAEGLSTWKENPRVTVHKIDFSEQEGPEKLQELVTNGSFDVLINNAATYVGRKHMDSYKSIEIERTLRVNFVAPILATIGFAESSVGRNTPGDVINISSVNVKHGGSPYSVDYLASKNSLEAATLSIAKKYAMSGIRINLLRIGVMNTDFHSMNPNKNMSLRIEQMPTAKIIETIEVSELLLSIIKLKTRSITGEVFEITGGE